MLYKASICGGFRLNTAFSGLFQIIGAFLSKLKRPGCYKAISITGRHGYQNMKKKATEVPFSQRDLELSTQALVLLGTRVISGRLRTYQCV